MLFLSGQLRGSILDYGCGRGHEANNLYFDCDGYDPHFRPKLPNKKYDVIICNYVLNVIKLKKDRQAVINDIRLRLNPDGVAFITVRNDIRGSYVSSRGNWQGNVTLPYPLVKKCSGYKTYRLTKYALYN